MSSFSTTKKYFKKTKKTDEAILVTQNWLRKINISSLYNFPFDLIKIISIYSFSSIYFDPSFIDIFNETVSRNRYKLSFLSDDYLTLDVPKELVGIWESYAINPFLNELPSLTTFYVNINKLSSLTKNNISTSKIDKKILNFW